MSDLLFSHRELMTSSTPPKKQRGIEELARFINFEQFRPVLRKHCQGEKKSNAGRPSYDLVKIFKVITL